MKCATLNKVQKNEIANTNFNFLISATDQTRYWYLCPVRLHAIHRSRSRSATYLLLAKVWFGHSDDQSIPFEYNKVEKETCITM